MSNINSVTLTGNLTREPKLTETSGGLPVLELSVASSNHRDEAHPLYIDCTVYGNRAEPLEGLLHKGDKVALAGYLRFDQWDAEDGSKHSKHRVVVSEVDLLSAKRQSDG